ncbi:hypothetical protein LguiB_021190 [Lonicera macranthoides]
MGRNIKTIFFAYLQLQSNKDSNWIHIRGSFFSHSLNDKSLQVTEIRDLNKRKANI